MQRRDLLRGALLLSSGLLGAIPLTRTAWGTPRATATITLIEDSSQSPRPDAMSSSTAEIWRLHRGQLLQPDDYARLRHAPPGTQLHSLLGAANHYLLLDALRQHGARLHIEHRVANSATPRYALHATL
ncbi:hypothetical protein ACTVZK_15725 [Pseudomonas aeruginosa]|uniref:hypothetical protein n=1 Tax=Pseudomonas aeruginosa TaxID=287 RepID=UPI00129DA72F|nr:hypothetical protein [Pseudomonas aeruginosa]